MTQHDCERSYDLGLNPHTRPFNKELNFESTKLKTVKKKYH